MLILGPGGATWVLKIQHQQRTSNLEDLGQARHARTNDSEQATNVRSTTPDFHYASNPQCKPFVGGLAGSMPDSARTARSTHVVRGRLTWFGHVPKFRVDASDTVVLEVECDSASTEAPAAKVREHGLIQATGVCLVRDRQRPANSRGINELWYRTNSAISAVARIT